MEMEQIDPTPFMNEILMKTGYGLEGLGMPRMGVP
jgi:hypothetical protein